MMIKKSDLYRLLWVNGGKYDSKSNLHLPEGTSFNSSVTLKGKHSITNFDNKQGMMQELLTGKTRLV